MLAHLQRRSLRWFGGEKVNRTLGARTIGPLWDGPVGLCWTLMVLGWEFCNDHLFFGTNMLVGCVALCISFPKYPRSSKSEFSAKSYSHFSTQDSGSWLGLVLGSKPCHLDLVLGSRPCHLGLDHVRSRARIRTMFYGSGWVFLHVVEGTGPWDGPVVGTGLGPIALGALESSLVWTGPRCYMVQLLSEHMKVTIGAPMVDIWTWGHVARSGGPDLHYRWSETMVWSLDLDLCWCFLASPLRMGLESIPNNGTRNID
jgi:hypothetical protein